MRRHDQQKTYERLNPSTTYSSLNYNRLASKNNISQSHIDAHRSSIQQRIANLQAKIMQKTSTNVVFEQGKGRQHYRQVSNEQRQQRQQKQQRHQRQSSSERAVIQRVKPFVEVVPERQSFRQYQPRIALRDKTGEDCNLPLQQVDFKRQGNRPVVSQNKYGQSAVSTLKSSSINRNQYHQPQSRGQLHYLNQTQPISRIIPDNSLNSASGALNQAERLSQTISNLRILENSNCQFDKNGQSQLYQGQQHLEKQLRQLKESSIIDSKNCSSVKRSSRNRYDGRRSSSKRKEKDIIKIASATKPKKANPTNKLKETNINARHIKFNTINVADNYHRDQPSIDFEIQNIQASRPCMRQSDRGNPLMSAKRRLQHSANSSPSDSPISKSAIKLDGSPLPLHANLSRSNQKSRSPQPSERSRMSIEKRRGKIQKNPAKFSEMMKIARKNMNHQSKTDRIQISENCMKTIWEKIEQTVKVNQRQSKESASSICHENNKFINDHLANTIGLQKKLKRDLLAKVYSMCNNCIYK